MDPFIRCRAGAGISQALGCPGEQPSHVQEEWLLEVVAVKPSEEARSVPSSSSGTTPPCSMLGARRLHAWGACRDLMPPWPMAAALQVADWQRAAAGWSPAEEDWLEPGLPSEVRTLLRVRISAATGWLHLGHWGSSASITAVAQPLQQHWCTLRPAASPGQHSDVCMGI